MYADFVTKSVSMGGTDLISCSNVTDTDTSYCCDHTVNCCDSGVGRFEVLPLEPQTWATLNTASSKYIVVRTLADESTSTSLAILASTTAASSTFASTTTTASSIAVVATAEPTEAEPEGLTGAAKAGIGIGVSVGALLVVAVVFLLWKIWRNKKLMTE